MEARKLGKRGSPSGFLVLNACGGKEGSWEVGMMKIEEGEKGRYAIMPNAKLLVDQINGIIIEILKTGSAFSGSLKSWFKCQQIFLISIFSGNYSRNDKHPLKFPGSQLHSFPTSLF